MTAPRKPAAGFWITATLVAVLVGYPLSFGPVCWITSHTDVGAAALPVIYRPVTFVMTRSPAISVAITGTPDSALTMDGSGAE